LIGGLVLALLLGAAHAEEVAATQVLITPFRERNPEAAGFASLLTVALALELAEGGRLVAVPLASVEDVHDMDAGIYAQSCPPGEEVGCAYVLGVRAGVPLAFAGAVTSAEDGFLVEIQMVDVGGAREMLSFGVILGVGDDDAFFAGVREIVMAAVRGEAGQVRDVRENMGHMGHRIDLEQARYELDLLAEEIGGIESMGDRSGIHIEPPEFTVADLAEAMDREGSKPWERLKMGPKAYLRYRNSGLRIDEWKGRVRGRHGQIILRPMLGVLRGPVDGEYYGRYVDEFDGSDFVIAEAYAWQAMGVGTGLLGLGSLGVGLSPFWEVALVGGVVTGQHAQTVHKSTLGQLSQPPASVQDAQISVAVGVQTLLVPVPAAQVRPVVGGRLVRLRGSSVDSHQVPPSALPSFEAPVAWLAEGIVGLEARMGSGMDFVLQVPVGVVLAGATMDPYHQGEGAIDELRAVPGGVQGSAGLMMGFQLRFGGVGDGLGTGLERYEERDE